MPAGVLAVVVWTCVGLFVGVVLLGFAALAGIWQPRDEETGKWLKRSVVFPLVGGVVGFATFVFASERGLPPRPTPTPEPSPFLSPSPHPSRTDAPPEPTPAPTATPTPVPTRTPVPDDPRPPVARCGVAVPQALADWARDHLGEPPDFTCAEQQPYPQCVATLQGRSRPEISRVAARQCGDDLAAFRRSFVAPVYGAKASYQINLDHTEFALRSGVSDDAADRHDYVAAEISRMNGREWDRFVAIDRKSREDMRACQDERRCLEPSEGG